MITQEDKDALRKLGPFYGSELTGLRAFENLRMFEEDFQLIARVLNEVAKEEE